MVQTTTIAGVPVVKIGHGLMMMTSTPAKLPDEQCFEAIKAGIESAPPGVKVFLNSGEFYGYPPNWTANLELLNRFFTKYPEYAERTFLSIKGGAVIDSNGLSFGGSETTIERSINDIIKKLGPNKKLDLFECARVDPKTPIEETIAVLNKFVESGKISYIGISEVSAATLERASKVGKIAVAEIEVSPWSYEEETKKVIAKAAETGTVIAAYSPLGRGLLTGNFKPEDLPEGDFRRNQPWFSEENLKKNKESVEKLAEIAKKKNITSAQLCLAWVSSLGPHIVPIPGSSRAQRTLENMVAASITLDDKEVEEIKHIMELNPVSGTRYDDHNMKMVWG
ncbi:aldo/keto reductase [Ceratobasidium sp. AG-I]|nr:aldo/keto reductase [Ceratobasidium sp. AG-I]